MKTGNTPLRVSLGLLLWTAAAQAQGTVYISEFMAMNAKTLADQDRDYPDWIELYNPGPEEVNLGGWYLTQSTNRFPQWVLPSTNLAPNTCLVVFASGKNRAVAGRELHTDFSLDDQGEYLALFPPEGDEPASEYAPAFPKQFTDLSYGIYQGRKYYFSRPTPRLPNDAPGFENYVADTKFDHGRGFYPEPFVLRITCATPDAVIRYTTNGSLPTLANGLTYSSPITISNTACIRAAAFKTGSQPSNVDTHTYLFLDDIIRQSPTGAAPPGWPTSWGSNVRDYGMDPDVVNNPKYKDTIKADLQTIPSFSLVMDLKDLFGSSGIYANAQQDGRTWERRGSIELIYPDGAKGFQIEAGIRIRGGYSRSTGNPKHAFRFFFRDDYGAPKLKYPLFGDRGADRFDCVDLRCAQNYSWSFEGDSRGVFLRDQFSRDSQMDMGWHAERGDFYHLYINGQYWGLYNTCERTEASYGATYLGGNKADYDVIKVAPDNGYTILATDGNLQAWTRLYNQCKAGVTNDAIYQKLQGNNPDGTRNPAYENLIDVTNLVDYMLVILYGGNLDAPISNFLGNNNPNNWYGVRNRTGTAGFVFFAHDSEHTLLNLSEDRTGPYAAGNSSVTTSSPQWVWQKLWANLEFKVLVGDRAHRYFFNGGALSPEVCAARFLRRKNEIDRAVVGESARWGDSKRNPPLTRDDWLNSVNNILNSFIPGRSAVVLDQLKRKGLYPSVVAPSFSQHGGVIQRGFALTLSYPAGPVYYTLDGTDPRQRGGGLSAAAQRYQAPVPLTETVQVMARALQGTNWSALNEAVFTMTQTFTNLLITEIMYHPPPEGVVDGDEFEFLELKNLNPVEVDLSGVRFTNGVSFTFPRGTRLGPGQFAVLVSNPTNFSQRYPGVPVAGVYSLNLANGGETLTLVHAVGTPIFSVTYGDRPPWPAAADGLGFSLVPLNPGANSAPDDPANWRASSRLGGSPGADDPAPVVAGLVISEILTHTDPPEVDAIELFNPTGQDVDIGYWFLTDDRSQPRKFRIPAPKVLAPGEYWVYDEAQFNPSPGDATSFSLSSLGEEVYLYSADAAGALTGYSDGFAFGAAANGVTFGRYTNSVGEVHWPPQAQNTLGRPNGGPRVGPVVINEIMYQPPPGGAEFLELKNLSDQPVPLYDPLNPTNTWRLNGIGFDFPTNVLLAPHALLLLAPGDPEVLRARYNVPARVPILGPYPGVLQDGGERLELQRPDPPEVDTNSVVTVPYVTVDEVRYNDRSPWPTNAAGLGSSLERLRPELYGDDPANWRASPGPPSPGLENDGNRPPVVSAGPDQELEAALFPVQVELRGSATDDGLPNPPRTLRPRWSQVAGPGVVYFNSAGALATRVALPGVGAYVLRLSVDDTDLQASDDLILSVSRPANQATLLPAGAVWRYLDNGSDQGTAWRALEFDDSTWRTNATELGYGDGDETGIVGYGPDANNKYITTYFRKTFTVANVAAVTSLSLKVVRDDGIAVYLNGNEVFRDNLPEGPLNYQSRANTAIGGADESAWLDQALDHTLLREGTNVVAVEIHQSSPTSSDISFNLQLEALAFPANRPPVATAGGDRQVTLPAPAALLGAFNDDALPNPPGVVAISWSKASGPGPVVFVPANSLESTAHFEAAGAYVVRLTIDDGVFRASDDLAVTVATPAEPLRIQSASLVDWPVRGLRILLEAAAGKTYIVQYCDVLGEAWQELRQVQAGAAQQVIEVVDPIPPDRPSRYYRVVEP